MLKWLQRQARRLVSPSARGEPRASGIGRLARPGPLRVSNALLVGLLGCGAPEGALVIADPIFGPASVRIEIHLDDRYVEGSLRVRFGGLPATASFERTASGALADLPAAPGPVRVTARALFANGAATFSAFDDRDLHVPIGTPALETSLPTDGAAGVARTTWFDLHFGSAVPPASLDTFALSCDDVGLPADLTLVSDHRLVVNPAPELAPDAVCHLGWTGPSGAEWITIGTAAAGPAETFVYDRDDPRSLLPFPDDYWLVPDPTTATGVRHAVDVPEGPFDLENIASALLAETNTLDGFSPNGYAVVELTAPADPDSLASTREETLDPTASVGVFDLTPGPTYGQRVPYRAEARTDTLANGVTSHTLVFYPAIDLDPFGRYGLVVTRRVFADPGRPYEGSAFYQAARGPAQPGESDAVAAVRTLSQEVLDVVGQQAVPPIPEEDVALAIRFSIRSMDISKELLFIQEYTETQPAPPVTLDECLPANHGDCTGVGGTDVAGCILGTFEATEWRDTGGALPLNFAHDANGNPVPGGTKDLPFVLALPQSAGPVPLVMYQHGNPGTAQSEVPSNARRFLAAEGFAVAGFTDTINREVSAGSGGEVAIQAQTFGILSGIITFGRVPDFQHQTNAEQMAFVAATESLAAEDLTAFCDAAGVGVPNLDPTVPLLYKGISGGANHAPGLLAYTQRIKAATMTVGGGRISETLIHQASDTLIPQLGTFFPSLTPAEALVGLAFFQANSDRQEQHNHARFIYREPIEVLGNTRKPSILFQIGLDDGLVPNNASDSMAWLMGPLPFLEPVQRPVGFLPLVTGPVTANVDAWTTTAYYQFVPTGVPGIDPTPGCLALSPSSGSEGHFCAQSAAEAFAQRIEFFQSALTDPAPTIIDPLAP